MLSLKDGTEVDLYRKIGSCFTSMLDLSDRVYKILRVSSIAILTIGSVQKSKGGFNLNKS